MSVTSSSPKLPKAVVPQSIFVIPFLADVAGMLLIFAIGRNLAEDGSSLLVLGLVGGGHALAMSISSIFCGPLSDRIGRDRIIIPGMCLFIVAAVICSLADFGTGISLSMYWVSALSLGMIHPATIAWVNTGSPVSKSQKSQGVSKNLIRFCISWNLGVLVAQLGGGELFILDARLPYIAAAVVTVINLFVAIRISRIMSNANPSTSPRVGDTKINAKTTDFVPIDPVGNQSELFVRLAWLANLGGAVSVSMLLHLFPRLAVGLGIPADRHGAILASMRVVAIGVYILLHKTHFWHFRFSVNIVVQSVCAVGLIIIFYAQSSLFLTVGVGLVAILVGFNYFSGLYYGSAGHEESKRGFASGMHEATLGLGVAIGSAGGGIVGEIAGDRFPYFLAMVIVVGLIGVQSIYYFIKKSPLRNTSVSPGTALEGD